MKDLVNLAMRYEFKKKVSREVFESLLRERFKQKFIIETFTQNLEDYFGEKIIRIVTVYKLDNAMHKHVATWVQGEGQIFNPKFPVPKFLTNMAR
jgi:hypothetical protein